MIFGFAVLATAVFLSLVAAYYSVVGLTAIFAAATIPVIIMGGALELGKIMATVWLHNNWRRAPIAFKLYLIPAVVFLMLLTSMGIFGFLSKAHLDQAVVSGDATTKIAIYDEKIKMSRENIEASRKALKQMDEAVDQQMARSNDEQGAQRAATLRRQQGQERGRILKDIESEQKKIQQLNEERAPVAAEVRKVEAEVGPIKYVAALLYNDDPDQNVLEKAVRFVIIMIVIVFDPLALCLILAANKQFEWALQGQGGWVHKDGKIEYPPDDGPLTDDQSNQIKDRVDPHPAGWMFKSWLFKDKDGTPEQIIDPQSVQPPETEIVSTDKEKNDDFKFLADDKDLYPEGKPWDTVEENKTSEEATIAEVSKLIAEETLQATEPTEPPKQPEAAPGPNRGKMYSAPIVADNSEQLGTGANSDFGNEFPLSPAKGDVYLRTDYLPNRLYKWNGKKWIEVDKSNNDLYAYDNMYIKHLIEEIDSGRYDPDTLTDLERQQIKDYLNKNA